MTEPVLSLRSNSERKQVLERAVQHRHELLDLYERATREAVIGEIQALLHVDADAAGLVACLTFRSLTQDTIPESDSTVYRGSVGGFTPSASAKDDWDPPSYGDPRELVARGKRLARERKHEIADIFFNSGDETEAMARLQEVFGISPFEALVASGELLLRLYDPFDPSTVER